SGGLQENLNTRTDWNGAPICMGPGYTFPILWHERSRFLTGVLAVAFSALLITVQCGMLLGVFSIMSLPVDHAAREFKGGEAVDVWVGHPTVLSVDLGLP